MTYSPTLALTLIKAAQHKYTHKKRVGTDKKGRARYRYYYKRHHGGGITGAKFEEGSAFKLTWKGRRGHFHIKSIEGDMVKISHDARPDVDIPPIHRDELRAILERQHGAAETKSREKAQRKRRKSSAKKKSAKREKAPKTQERPPIERMSAAERKALDNDLAKALRDNDPETAHELIKKDQID